VNTVPGVVGSLAEVLTPAGAPVGLKKPAGLKKLVPPGPPVLPATFAVGVAPGWPAAADSFMAARRVFGVA
jgi:hypothetical protein